MSRIRSRPGGGGSILPMSRASGGRADESEELMIESRSQFIRTGSTAVAAGVLPCVVDAGRLRYARDPEVASLTMRSPEQSGRSRRGMQRKTRRRS